MSNDPFADVPIDRSGQYPYAPDTEFEIDAPPLARPVTLVRRQPQRLTLSDPEDESCQTIS